MVTLIIVKSIHALVVKDLKHIKSFLVTVVGFQPNDFGMKLLKGFGGEIWEGAQMIAIKQY